MQQILSYFDLWNFKEGFAASVWIHKQNNNSFIIFIPQKGKKNQKHTHFVSWQPVKPFWPPTL